MCFCFSRCYFLAWFIHFHTWSHIVYMMPQVFMWSLSDHNRLKCTIICSSCVVYILTSTWKWNVRDLVTKATKGNVWVRTGLPLVWLPFVWNQKQNPARMPSLVQICTNLLRNQVTHSRSSQWLSYSIHSEYWNTISWVHPCSSSRIYNLNSLGVKVHIVQKQSTLKTMAWQCAISTLPHLLSFISPWMSQMTKRMLLLHTLVSDVAMIYHSRARACTLSLISDTDLMQQLSTSVCFSFLIHILYFLLYTLERKQCISVSSSNWQQNKWDSVPLLLKMTQSVYIEHLNIIFNYTRGANILGTTISINLVCLSFQSKVIGFWSINWSCS